MTDAPPMQPLNPVEIEQAIRDAVTTVEQGIDACTVRLSKYKQADAAYDLAFAQAYMEYAGAAHAKKYAAEIATGAERQARDEAEVAWRYAERRMKSAELTLSAYQTLAKSITAAYGAAGHQ